jgi:transketolase
MPRGLSTREAYGQVLVELGEENQDIVVLDADLSKSTMTCFFAERFPERFFDCGIAEQNMIGIAAGLAASGKTVFASTFAIFATARCFDQLRMSVAQPGLNVKIVASHGGITVGEDGFSHQSVEDLALMCSLPGFKVIVPADAEEARQAVRLAASTDGPFYIRLSRPKTPAMYDKGYRFQLGKAVTMQQGNDVAIISTGIMLANVMEAARRLERQGITCRVLSMPTVKPLDQEAILQAARDTGAIVTVEEHLEHGGLGSRVAQVVVESEPVPMQFVALKDTYAKSGRPDELLEKYGLGVGHIEKAVHSVLSKKERLRRS